MTETQRLAQAIREAVENHEPAPDDEGCLQWYVRGNAIDCDADEFWQVVEQAIRKAIS